MNNEVKTKLQQLRQQMVKYPWSSGSALLMLDEIIADTSAPWTQADADEWAERHDLRIHGSALFCAFEDAATLHLTRKTSLKDSHD
jgi:hypothetical protein